MANHREPNASRATVIVVDADAAVRNSLKFSLEIEGFAVRLYAGGADLLRAADLAGDCLVVDQEMPGISGLDLVARLHAGRFRVPVILVTSRASSAVSSRAAHAGIPIVEKPFLGSALVDSIRDAVTEGHAG